MPERKPIDVTEMLEAQQPLVIRAEYGQKIELRHIGNIDQLNSLLIQLPDGSEARMRVRPIGEGFDQGALDNAALLPRHLSAADTNSNYREVNFTTRGPIHVVIDAQGTCPEGNFDFRYELQTGMNAANIYSGTLDTDSARTGRSPLVPLATGSLDLVIVPRIEGQSERRATT